MFLSQQIATDEDFFKDLSCYEEHAVSLRSKIVRAMKMIVPDDFMPSTLNAEQTLRFVLGPKKFEEKDYRTREGIFCDFARPPFPLLFLENSTDGFLIEEIGGTTWSFTRITKAQRLMPVKARVTRPVDGVRSVEFDPLGTRFFYEEMITPLKEQARSDMLLLSHVLTLVNSKRKRVQRYKTKVVDTLDIPREEREYFNYYMILDVLRERPKRYKYDSVDTILAWATTPKLDRDPTGLIPVRGHFMRLASGEVTWRRAHFRSRPRRKNAPEEPEVYDEVIEEGVDETDDEDPEVPPLKPVLRLVYNADKPNPPEAPTPT